MKRKIISRTSTAVEMGKSRFKSMMLTTIAAACLIFLTLLLVLPTFSSTSSSCPLGDFTGTKISREKVENVGSSLASDSEHTSSQPAKLAIDDKLLGGLLSTEFDEESCISRYQSNSLRKPSPHKPSASLLSALRKYEHHHRRCGPHTKSYNSTIKQLNSTHPNSTGPDCNYIVWLAINGLGNRMINMVSAFLYALLTNRILLIDHGPDMSDLFCEPFPNTSWLLPKDFPLKNQFHFHNFYLRKSLSFGNLLKNYKGNISMVALHERPSYLYLYLGFNYDEFDKLFYSNEHQDFLRRVPWLFLNSGQYFVPSLYSMGSFKEEIDRLFPDKETVFHHLGRYLFHPTNQAWGLITRFYDAYLAKADEKIGLQIRVFNTEVNPSHVVMETVLACARNQNLLPQVDKHKHQSSPSKNRTSKAILVASLSPVYNEKLKSIYWNSPTVNGEVIGVYQASHEEYQHFGNNMHNMKALAEIYLLSLSDVLVTSAWSTFGYIAQGLGGLKPWILLLGHTPDSPILGQPPASPCKRAMSMEPCFHFPPSFHQTANVRQCEDVGWGVKLVN